MLQSPKKSNTERLYKMTLKSVYPLYIKKVEKKGRSKEDVDEIIVWLTGYTKEEILLHMESGTDFETLFSQAPRLNPNSSKITGSICGYRVEDIEDSTVRNIRYLDKLIDELAKGKPMEKILRK